MKVKCICIHIGIICISTGCGAWNNATDFECAVTNALEHTPILVSVGFRDSLTNYIETASDHESRIAARIVLGESFLADYNETMDERCLTDAMSVATNVCELTCAETNTWYCWQSKLLVFACHAQKDDMISAYNVASNALATIGTINAITDSPIAAAQLKRNQAEGLSVQQAIMLSKALSAAMLQKDIEATNLVSSLPIRYHDMVGRILNGD